MFQTLSRLGHLLLHETIDMICELRPYSHVSMRCCFESFDPSLGWPSSRGPVKSFMRVVGIGRPPPVLRRPRLSNFRLRLLSEFGTYFC